MNKPKDDGISSSDSSGKYKDGRTILPHSPCEFPYVFLLTKKTKNQRDENYFPHSIRL